MKKILLTIFGVLFSFQLAFAALNAAIVWEVRTTGASTNGGGFKTGATGTDYSQQDAAQYALTGCTTAAANAIILNANAAADMVGNVCQVISGTNFTPGFYEIVSVSVGVSLTVDRNCTTDVGALGVVNVGGAVIKPADIVASVVAGNTIYIKSGTYTSQLFDLAVDGTAEAYIKWVGYTGSRAEANLNDRPIFNGNGVDYTVLIADQAYNEFRNLKITNSTRYGCSPTGLGLIFKNCRFYSCGLDGTSGGSVTYPVFIGCEADSNSRYGFNHSNSGGTMINCYSHDNADVGYFIFGSRQGAGFIGCISESNSSHGFLIDGATGNRVIYGCIAYNNTGTSDGIYLNYSSDQGICLINNISMNNGRYGFNKDTGCTINLFDFNSYYGNATAGLNNITAGSHDITTDPLFTAPTANPPDFTLQSASPCKDAGFPDADWAANVGLAAGRY